MSKILIDEATVKLALEALEYIHEGANNQGPHTGISWRCVSNKAEPAITALREELAKPDFWEGYVPEPVKQGPVYHLRQYGDVTKEQLDRYMATGDINPQPAQQEPVAYPEGDVVGPCICGSWPGGKCLKCIRITTPPAQRTWVGLTDEEIDEWTPEIHTIIQAIEAKLKEKNT